VKRTS